MKSEVIQYRLDKNNLDKLRAVSAANGLSLGMNTRLAVLEYIDRKLKNPKENRSHQC